VTEERRAVDPDALKALEGSLGERVKRSQGFLDRAQKLLDKKPEDSPDRKGAIDEYKQAVGAEKKAAMWDNIIRALGKVTAGTVGLHGLGIGGKQIIQPGLDVSKYYDEGKGYDVQPGMDAAKNVLEKRTSGDTALQERSQQIKDLVSIYNAIPPDDVEGRMKVMDMLSGVVKTSQQQAVSTESKAGVTADPRQGGGGKDAKVEFAEVASEKEASDINRAARVSYATTAGYSPINREIIRTRFVPAYQAGTDKLLDATEEEVKAELDPKEKNLKATNPEEYWKKVDTRLTEKSNAYFSPPEILNSPDYSVWQMGVRDPVENALGSRPVRVQNTRASLNGKTYYLADIYNNPDSAYSKKKAQLSADPEFKKMNPTQQNQAIYLSLKKDMKLRSITP
jgi:hypothetical protein